MGSPSTPSRKQIAAIAKNDQYMIKAFEELFNQAGTISPENIEAIAEALSEHVGDETNPHVVTYEQTGAKAPIDANTARIKTNEVLLWLSM